MTDSVRTQQDQDFFSILLALKHGFHETKQGVRFSISEAARREVLQRLLKLNHERCEEELTVGLQGKSASKILGVTQKLETQIKHSANDVQSGFDFSKVDE